MKKETIIFQTIIITSKQGQFQAHYTDDDDQTIPVLNDKMIREAEVDTTPPDAKVKTSITMTQQILSTIMDNNGKVLIEWDAARKRPRLLDGIAILHLVKQRRIPLYQNF